MKTTSAILAFAILGATTVLAARPPKKPPRPTVRGQINKAVNQIEKETQQLLKELQSAREEIPMVQLELTQTRASYQEARDELREQEKSLQDRLGTKVGLADALAAFENADEAYDDAIAKLTERLADDEKFQELIVECEGTEARLDQFRADRSQAKNSESETLRKAAKDALAAREALKNRLDGDPKVKPALEAKRQAEEELKQARQTFDKAADSDPELKRAEKYERQSREAYRQAQQTATKLQTKIVAIQQQIARNLLLAGP